MLAWSSALYVLLFAGAASTGPKPSILEVAGRDTLLDTLLKLGFADLYQTFYVSKEFRKVTKQAIGSLYSIQHNGRISLNYSKIIYELDAIVQDAGKDKTIAEANAALKKCPGFRGIQSVLRAQFGCCIKYGFDKLPEFHLREEPIAILDDACRVSALPYIIDQHSNWFKWIEHIQGLIDIGRLDLLDQLTFPQINDGCFYELMGIVLPESVMLAAAKSLQINNPHSELLTLLALTVLGNQTTTVPKDFVAPLCSLRFLHENKIELPESLILVDGLSDSSLSFWMYLIAKKKEEAEELLNLVLKHGDDLTRCLADAFYRLVPHEDFVSYQTRVYHSMLIRIRFSPLCNDHIVQNYERMLEKLVKLCPHTVSAFLDCRQYQLLRPCAISTYGEGWDVIIYRLCRLKDKGLSSFTRRLFDRFVGVPELLKRLVRQDEVDSYAQVAWEFMQASGQSGRIAEYCCSAPLAVLKSLLLEKDISMHDIEKMVDALHGFMWQGRVVSKELHCLYTAMFWEAPEDVVDYFLGQVPGKCRLELEHVWKFILLEKYSAGLAIRLMKRLGPESLRLRKKRAKFLPDLVAEP